MFELPAPTALIVDDNYFNRDLCSLALQFVGYSVTEATNGQEAVQILTQNTFDLLILDLAMPEINGVGVIRQISNQPRHRDMSIVVMTANPHMATDEVSTNADFVMHKPIAVEEFAQLARRLAHHASKS
jgi:CheY-like chemotaxis protein